MILLEDTQVISGLRVMIIVGIVMVLVIVALAVFNGTRNPRQYKKDWARERREREARERREERERQEASENHRESVKD